MAGSSILKRTAAAQTVNTDVIFYTPTAGQRVKILSFYVNNETAAQAAGMNFELRFGSNIIAIVGFNVAAAPIGGFTNTAILNHEVIGDGTTAIQFRNLTVLNTSSVCAGVISIETTPGA